MDDFDVVWNILQTSLKPGAEIKNWNAYNGYLGDNLTIDAVDSYHISVDPPRVWDTQIIPKEDFKKIWNIWGDYKILQLSNKELKGQTEYLKYIISIFHWYEIEHRSI
jgi:hypothetical protein